MLNHTKRVSVAYKPKYLAAEAHARYEKQRADSLQKELERLHVILADQGESVLDAAECIAGQPTGDSLILTPLKLECVKAFIRSTVCITEKELVLGKKEFRDYTYMTWRGRPIQVKET